MTQDTWTAVDDYIEEQLVPADSVLEVAMAASQAAGLPSIAVSSIQGRLLMILAQAAGAKRILEIGTLGGYSSIWLARALPKDGRLITLEFDPKHAEVARKNLAKAGFGNMAEVRLGKALETLPKLASEGAAPFDIIFIDANKDDYPGYLEWAIKLSRPGTLIIADNVIRDGQVADASNPDPQVQGVRRMYELAASEPRLKATAIQTVGSRGYDGLFFAVVEGNN